VINFESYKGLFARVHHVYAYIHIRIYICLKARFDRSFYTFLALLYLISCYGFLFSHLDTQGVTQTLTHFIPLPSPSTRSRAAAARGSRRKVAPAQAPSPCSPVCECAAVVRLCVGARARAPATRRRAAALPAQQRWSTDKTAFGVSFLRRGGWQWWQ
jgi:hypothetical protein